MILVSCAVSLTAHRLFSVVTPNALQDIGVCLTNAVRRTAEWPSENFNPSPLLLIISILMKNNPTEAKV